jgi:hypothetical protein
MVGEVSGLRPKAATITIGPANANKIRVCLLISYPSRQCYYMIRLLVKLWQFRGPSCGMNPRGEPNTLSFRRRLRRIHEALLSLASNSVAHFERNIFAQMAEFVSGAFHPGGRTAYDS